MIAAVIPLLLVAAGAIALLVGVAVLRSFGPRYRVGRLLATTSRVSVAAAVDLAQAGAPRYVRIDGRIEAEDEFEDVHHRPLVFRRTRLEALDRGRWSRFEDSQEAVRFEIREGLDAIEIDAGALDAGLVVVPRESTGVAGDLGERGPADRPPETAVRAIVEQVSSVDHAIVLGVPTMRAGDEGRGAALLTAGLGRPLVLTTLEPEEAMRVLAGGTGRPRFAAACLVAGAALVGVGLAWAGLSAVLPAIVPGVLAASPSPATGGDPRSSGEGPGLVGEPFLAILAVAAIAIIAIMLTKAYIRWATSRAGPRSR